MDFDVLGRHEGEVSLPGDIRRGRKAHGCF